MDVALWDRLDGQTVLVSGANRGLGAQVSADLAALGATVFAGARDPRELAGIEEESDGRIRPVPLDVRDEGAIEAAVHRAVEATGRLDIVVNNAGVGDFRGRVLHTLETSLLDTVLETNLRGPMLMAKHALPRLLEATGDGQGPGADATAGRIVNVSSGMGALMEGMSGTAPTYRVSKAGLNGLTAYLHGEYGMRGLIASSVCPGWVRTDMGGQNARRSLQEGADTIVWLCRFRPGAPGGRFWRDRHVIDW